jgi:hypothetical protein
VTFAVRLTCQLTIPPSLPSGLRLSSPTPSSRTHDQLGSSRVTPHLPGTAHPCPSRSALAHSFAFPTMSLSLHRRVSAARHASSPHPHVPVRYAGARATLTCALSPYAALELLGHLCSCARPRPYTHTQALCLLHVRPCHMTNALSRRLRLVTTLGLFTSHLSRSRRVLPFALKKLSLSLLSSIRNSHLHILLLRPAPTRVRVHPWPVHYACDATTPARLPHCLASRALASPVVWTSLGLLPRWVPGPTTRWAPGTT